MDDLVKQLMHATVSIDGDFDVGCNVRDAVVERLERADAATAAAYEVAARAIMEKCHDDMDRKEEAAIVRALASADHTAALDKLIAEAEARGMERAAEIANKLLVRSKFGSDTLTEVVYNDFVGAAILDASKKGGQ